MKMFSLLRVIFVILAFGFIVVGLYYVYSEHQKLVSTVDFVALEQRHLKEMQETAQPAADSMPMSVVSDVGKGFAWSDLKPKFANTVVQIFSQIAEFNWLQPWRAPNRGQASGSGFFISEDGLIITNAHVVSEARMVMVKVSALGKRQFEVEVVGLSTDRDLALLKLKPGAYNTIKAALGRIPYLSLYNSDKSHRADEVMALGYPLGQLSLKSTTGVISGWEHVMGNHLVQMDAAINPGSSGGPVLNRDGQVIGVSVAGIMGAQNVGYIIPSNDVNQFVQQVQKIPAQEGMPAILNKPFLGVSFCNSTDTLTSYLGNPHPGGLVVVDVFEDGPLGKAGIKRGDMMYTINGHRIDLYGEVLVPDLEDEKISVIDYAGRLHVGDTVHLTLYRNGKKIDVTTELTSPDPEVWPLRKPHLPGIDFDTKNYEIIGGLCIMPLTRNHLSMLIQSAPMLGKFADVQAQREKALIVTDVVHGSSAYRDKVVGPGVILDKVNDEPVKTLDELRAAIKKGVGSGYLKIETQEKFFMVFSLPEVVQEAAQLGKENVYKVSPFMKELQQLVGGQP